MCPLKMLLPLNIILGSLGTQTYFRVRAENTSAFVCSTVRLRSFGVIRIRISDPMAVWSMVHQRTGESMTRAESPVPLMHHDPDRSRITDPDPDHPKGTQPK